LLKLALFSAVAFLGYRLVRQIGGRPQKTREIPDPDHRPTKFDSTRIVDAEYEDLEDGDGGE